MMILKILLMIAVIYPTISNGQVKTHMPRTSQEQEAQQIIAQTDFTLQEVYTRIKTFLFMNKEDRTANDLTELALTLFYMHNTTVNLAQRLSHFNVDHFYNEEIKRQLRRSLDTGLLVLTFDQLRLYNDNLNAMRSVGTHPGTCARSDRLQCDLAYLPDVLDIYAESNDPNELTYYWEEWRKTIVPLAKRILDTFLNLYREVAMKKGMYPPSAEWYSKFEDRHMLDELTTAMEELRPLYMEFYGYVRHALNAKYGEDVVASRGLIPQHLFEQTLIQAWKPDSILRQPYPEVELPDLDALVRQQQYTSYSVVQESDLFYTDMGQPPLPQSLWNNNMKELPPSEVGPDCKAEPFIFRKELTLKYCPAPTFKKLMQMHGVMAKVRYGFFRSSLPLNLDGEACPGMAEALGESVILSASSPKHLKRINLAPRYEYNEQVGLNRLFRLGIHTIFSVPMHFVHEKLAVDLLDGRANLDNLNCYYWHLMETYLGVQPPAPRSRNDFDMSYRFYLGLDDNAHTTNKLVSEFLGYQFYRSFCKMSHQYVERDENKPLDNCDFSGNAEVGTAMLDLMMQGSRKHWREVIYPAVGNNKISADAMLEFYEPLKKWLVEQNRQNNVTYGWDSTNRMSCR